MSVCWLKEKWQKKGGRREEEGWWGKQHQFFFSFCFFVRCQHSSRERSHLELVPESTLAQKQLFLNLNSTF